MSKNRTKKPAQTGTAQKKRKGFHLHLTTTIITVLLTLLGIVFFRLGFTTNYYVYGEMNSTLIQWLLIGAVVSAIAAVVLTKAFPKAFWPKWITFVTTGLLAAAALILIGDRVEGIGNCIMTDYDSGHGGEEAIYYSLGGAVAMLIAMIYNIIGSFREESDAPAGKGKTLALSLSAGVLGVATIIAILGLVGVDLTGGTSIGPGTTTGEKAVYTITYNMNNENLDSIQTYQFLSGDLSGMLHYDARFYVDMSLELDGQGNYTLTSDAYCVENGKRATIGDDSGLGMNLKTTAEGTYVQNADGTITTSAATHAVHQMEMDTYSQQMKGAAQMNVGGNDADGIYDSRDEEAVLAFVPETVWTVDQESRKILGYKKAPLSGTFTITYNVNNENLDGIQTCQFLSGDLSGMLHYDARFYIDYTLKLENGIYELTSDAYCVENGKRAKIGDDTGLGMILKTTAEGLFTENEDGTITTHTPTHAVHEMKMDTYSQQMKGAAQMNVGGNDADGTYDSNSEPAVLDMVPETTWTLDDGAKAIVAYEVVAEEEEPATEEAVTEEPAEEENVTEGTTAEESAAEETTAEEATDGETVDAGAEEALLTVPSTDGGTTVLFYDDAKFVFDFSAYGIQEIGTWNYTDGKLTVINPNGLEATAEGDPLKLHYVSAASEQLTGDYEIPASSFEGGTEVPLEEGTPVEEEAPVGEAASVMIPSDDEGTTMTFNSDGTYRFFFEAYSVEDIGTYTYEDGILTLTDANGLQYTAEGDPMKLHYGFSGAPDQLTGEYTISADVFDF